MAQNADNPRPRGAKRAESRSDQAAKAAVGSGFEFAAAVAAFAIGGHFLDKWQGTTPLWTIIGAAIGFIGGGYNLYKSARRLMASSAPRSGASAGRVHASGDGKLPEAGPTTSATHGNEHVPAFQERTRPSRGDRGMFGRDQPEDDEIVSADEIRWPKDAPANDTTDEPWGAEETGGETR